VDVDTSDGNFILDEPQPIAFITSGTVTRRETEEKMGFISAKVSEFSSKETRSFIGQVQDVFFKFHHTPEYQYFSVFASSFGQNKTVFKKYIDGSWKSKTSVEQQSQSISASWSNGDEGGSITKSGSGYSFTLTKTKTRVKENREFGKIISTTKTTVNGSIRPLSKR
jgi:hypothetical protein